MHLKTELIRWFSPSKHKEVRQLFQQEQLGDCKPSQFLRHMRALAGNTAVDDCFLRTMWHQRIPSRAQTMLDIQPNLMLDQVTEIAERVVEVLLLSPRFIVLAVDPPQPYPELARHTEGIVRQLNSIQRHLD